jgi:hypothetical protein
MMRRTSSETGISNSSARFFRAWYCRSVKNMFRRFMCFIIHTIRSTANRVVSLNRAKAHGKPFPSLQAWVLRANGITYAKGENA